MRELISKQLKKDFSKLKELTGRFTKPKKETENVAKVIPPKNEEKKTPEGKIEEEIEQEQLQAGYIIKFAKEIECEVIDEEGNRIPCKTIAEAEILSRLIELRLFFMGQK